MLSETFPDDGAMVEEMMRSEQFRIPSESFFSYLYSIREVFWSNGTGHFNKR